MEHCEANEADVANNSNCENSPEFISGLTFEGQSLSLAAILS